MKARTFRYHNRLAKALSAERGLTAGQAVLAAEERLEVVRERSLGEIDRCVAEIARLAGGVRDPVDPAADQLYDAANRIAALGGVFGLAELSEAGLSLCELITRFRAAGRWVLPMVAVHVDALYVMRTPQDHPPARRQALKAGLHRILETALAA